MNPISMSYFVDFVVKSGTPKQTVVKNCKSNEGKYDVKTDFWKILREGLVKFHKDGNSSAEKHLLTQIIDKTIDNNRKEKYKNAIKSYQKFLGKKNITWFEPPRKEWVCGDFSVRVNPELGLIFDEKSYVIKLNLKEKNPVDKTKATILQVLMQQAINDEQYSYAILDVPKTKFYNAPVEEENYRFLLQGEAKCFETIYNNIVLDNT